MGDFKDNSYTFPGELCGVPVGIRGGELNQRLIFPQGRAPPGKIPKENDPPKWRYGGRGEWGWGVFARRLPPSVLENPPPYDV